MANERTSAERDRLRMVALTLPADENYLALARTTAMHVASLLLFPLAQVEDLRLAVDEACTSFLRPPEDTGVAVDGVRTAGLKPTGPMELIYDRYATYLQVTVRAAAPEHWLEGGELGWSLLRVLVGGVRASVHEGIGELTLTEPLPTGRIPQDPGMGAVGAAF